jgi:MoaA/NifB/PqqE/SkfB family radical SAM enzyme
MLFIKPSIATPILKTAPHFFANRPFVRRYIMQYLKRLLDEAAEATPPDDFPPETWRDKMRILKGLVHQLEHSDKNGWLSSKVFARVVDSFLVNSIFTNEVMDTSLSAEQRHPYLLLISPTNSCNLKCKGCYAGSDATKKDFLDFYTFDWILNQKREQWGSHFTAISGGEPFMWKSRGKNLLDMAERHRDEFFLVYTNGTLIDEETAARLEELGNVTPAISVEGFEKETDERRGKGVHQKVMQAFDRLRRYGVPFGISVTGTRHNWDLVTRDEFVDFYFYEQGAIYGWLFQYMPIGRSTNLDLMVSPEDRAEMWKRTWDLINRKQVFYADFWNSATASSGCICAGRPSGYYHIIWNGDITPCVFVPYAADNIYDVYERGGTINDVFDAPLFKRIREFQDNYAYQRRHPDLDNWLCPCPTRDHHEHFQKILEETKPRPIDHEAAVAMEDPDYIKGLSEYGKKLYEITWPIWESQYLKKTGSGEKSKKAV